MLETEPGFASQAVDDDDEDDDDDDRDDCVDPGTDDPESWDCECLEDMKKSCNGVNPECFKGIMCKFNEVCKSWKEEHCENSDDLLQGTDVLLQRAARANSSDAAGNRLDNSVKGKCAA